MQIHITNGEAKLKLTRTELKTLWRAETICVGIGKVRDATACQEQLKTLLGTFNEDGTERIEPKEKE